MATAAPVQADALERGRRTFLTGLGLDVAIAAAAAILAWLPAANVSDKVAWVALGTALIKTVLQAVASYVLRLKVTPKQAAPIVDGAYLVTDVAEKVPATPKAIDAYVKQNI